MDMKFLEKVAANRSSLFVVMKKTKQNKKSTTFRTYWHQGHTGTLHEFCAIPSPRNGFKSPK